MLTISIPQPILHGIFDECDRYSAEEIGGRLLGFYTWHGTDPHIDVKALIAAGPNAKRTRVSLFQDGEYQESVFRAVERNTHLLSTLVTGTRITSMVYAHYHKGIVIPTASA